MLLAHVLLLQLEVSDEVPEGRTVTVVVVAAAGGHPFLILTLRGRKHRAADALALQVEARAERHPGGLALGLGGAGEFRHGGGVALDLDS